MPFTSQAQARYLYSQHPEIADKWQREAPVRVSQLPERLGPKPKKTLRNYRPRRTKNDSL